MVRRLVIVAVLAILLTLGALALFGYRPVAADLNSETGRIHGFGTNI